MRSRLGYEVGMASGPPWITLLRPALRRAQRRYVQIATVSPEGTPEVRTVVLRRLTYDGRLLFITDTRSRKMRALTKNAEAEVHWYSERTREQFRLRGAMTVSRAFREELWLGLRAESQAPFFGPAPGGPLHGPVPTDPGPIPETFAALVHEVTMVDYLWLKTPKNERRIFRCTPGGWTQEEVVT